MVARKGCVEVAKFDEGAAMGTNEGDRVGSCLAEDEAGAAVVGFGPWVKEPKSTGSVAVANGVNERWVGTATATFANGAGIAVGPELKSPKSPLKSAAVLAVVVGAPPQSALQLAAAGAVVTGCAADGCTISLGAFGPSMLEAS